MKKLINMVMILGLLSFWAVSAYGAAANVELPEGKVIRIVLGTNDEDWLWSDNLPATGVEIFSIQFNPSATDDTCIIRQGTVTGPDIFNVKCADTYDQRIKYFGSGFFYKPCYNDGDSTAGTTSTIIIILR